MSKRMSIRNPGEQIDSLSEYGSWLNERRRASPRHTAAGPCLQRPAIDRGDPGGKNLFAQILGTCMQYAG
jgi:hypothetical protein